MKKVLRFVLLFLGTGVLFLISARGADAVICAPEPGGGCYCFLGGPCSGDEPYSCVCPGQVCGECDPFDASCCNQGGGCPPEMPCQSLWCWNHDGTCKVEFAGSWGYSCAPVYSYQNCGATDSCLGSDTLNAGLCSAGGCSVGGTYKTCCNDSGGTDPCNGGQFTGTCPNDTVFCGWGGYPACGPPACAAPTATLVPGEPTPTDDPDPPPPPPPPPGKPHGGYTAVVFYDENFNGEFDGDDYYFDQSNSNLLPGLIVAAEGNTSISGGIQSDSFPNLTGGYFTGWNPKMAISPRGAQARALCQEWDCEFPCGGGDYCASNTLCWSAGICECSSRYWPSDASTCGSAGLSPYGCGRDWKVVWSCRNTQNLNGRVTTDWDIGGWEFNPGNFDACGNTPMTGVCVMNNPSGGWPDAGNTGDVKLSDVAGNTAYDSSGDEDFGYEGKIYLDGVPTGWMATGAERRAWSGAWSGNLDSDGDGHMETGDVLWSTAGPQNYFTTVLVRLGVRKVLPLPPPEFCGGPVDSGQEPCLDVGSCNSACGSQSDAMSYVINYTPDCDVYTETSGYSSCDCVECASCVPQCGQSTCCSTCWDTDASVPPVPGPITLDGESLVGSTEDEPTILTSGNDPVNFIWGSVLGAERYEYTWAPVDSWLPEHWIEVDQSDGGTGEVGAMTTDLLPTLTPVPTVIPTATLRPTSTPYPPPTGVEREVLGVDWTLTFDTGEHREFYISSSGTVLYNRLWNGSTWGSWDSWNVSSSGLLSSAKDFSLQSYPGKKAYQHLVSNADTGTKLVWREREFGGSWTAWSATNTTIGVNFLYNRGSTDKDGCCTVTSMRSFTSEYLLSGTDDKHGIQFVVSENGEKYYARHIYHTSDTQWAEYNVSGWAPSGVTAIRSIGYTIVSPTKEKQMILTDDGKTVYYRFRTYNPGNDSYGGWGGWQEYLVWVDTSTLGVSTEREEVLGEMSVETAMIEPAMFAEGDVFQGQVLAAVTSGVALVEGEIYRLGVRAVNTTCFGYTGIVAKSVYSESYFQINAVPEKPLPPDIFPPEDPPESGGTALTVVQRHTCYDDPPHGVYGGVPEDWDTYYFVSRHEDADLGDNPDEIDEVSLRFVASSEPAKLFTITSSGSGFAEWDGEGVDRDDISVIAVTWVKAPDNDNAYDVTWEVVFDTDSLSNQDVYNVQAMTTDEFGSSSEWSESVQFKIWDCLVNLVGTFYDQTVQVPLDGCNKFYCLDPVTNALVPYGDPLSGEFSATYNDPDGDIGTPDRTDNWGGVVDMVYREKYVPTIENVLGDGYIPRYLGFPAGGDIEGCGVCEESGTNCCKMDPFTSFVVNESYWVSVWVDDPQIVIDVSVVAHEDPWFQILDCGARARESIRDDISEVCINDFDCDGSITAMVDFINGPVIINGITVDTGDDSDAPVGIPNNWKAVEALIPYDGFKFDYSYFDSRFTADLLASGGYFKFEGGETSWEGMKAGGVPTSVGSGEKAIILADGDVVIGDNISMAEGGIFMMIVSGSITIDSSVNSLQGVFVSNGEILVGDSPPNTQLKMEGILAGNVDLVESEYVILERDLEDGNLLLPGVEFTYRPDMLFALPLELQRNVVEWREVAP